MGLVEKEEMISKEELLSDLDKNKSYILVGVSKCGTTSMVKYLKDNGYDIVKQDGWFWDSKFIDDFKHDKTPLIVIRNPIERAWSHYNYSFQNKPEEATPQHIVDRRLEECSRKSAYTYFLARWMEKFDTVVLRYEEFVDLDDFPHENETKYKPKISNDIAEKIENYMMDELEDKKIYNKHW